MYSKHFVVRGKNNLLQTFKPSWRPSETYNQSQCPWLYLLPLVVISITLTGGQQSGAVQQYLPTPPTGKQIALINSSGSR